MFIYSQFPNVSSTASTTNSLEAGKTNVSFSFNKTLNNKTSFSFNKTTVTKIAVTKAFNTEEPEAQELPPSRTHNSMDDIEEEKRHMEIAEWVLVNMMLLIFYFISKMLGLEQIG